MVQVGGLVLLRVPMVYPPKHCPSIISRRAPLDALQKCRKRGRFGER